MVYDWNDCISRADNQNLQYIRILLISLKERFLLVNTVLCEMVLMNMQVDRYSLKAQCFNNIYLPSAFDLK